MLHQFRIALAAAVCLVTTASTAHAVSLDLRNGSFEFPKSSSCSPIRPVAEWDGVGNAYRGAGFNAPANPPTEGICAGEVVVNPSIGVPAAEVETFLELPLGKLDSVGQGPVTYGSALSQLVAIHADRWIRFDAEFGLFNDRVKDQFGFFSISQQLQPGVFFNSHVIVLADAESSMVIPPGESYPSTGYRSFSYRIHETAIYRIGFGVAMASDRREQSAMMVDNIRVVPEPGTLALLSLGLAGLGLSRRRKA